MTALLRKTGAFFARASTLFDDMGALARIMMGVVAVVGIALVFVHKLDALSNMPAAFETYAARDSVMHDAQLQELKHQTFYLRRQDCFSRTPRGQWDANCLGPQGPMN